MPASRRWLWVGLAAIAAALVFGGGAVVITRADEKRRVETALRHWAEAGGLEPDFLVAIGLVEGGGRLRISMTNTTGRDGELGGSYGCTQITASTARGIGYTGPMEELNRNPELAAQLTAKILNEARSRGDLTTLADYVAAWNAGKANGDRNNDGELEELPLTNTARTDYLPKAYAALEQIRSEAA